MRRVNVRKRGKVYQYQFEIGTINGKRKYINKSGFKTQNEAYAAGQIAYEKYINGGVTFKQSQMLYSDYLDYWMKEYFEINYKYTTAKRYSEAFETIKKEMGKYKLAYITPYILNQALLRIAQRVNSKDALRNYQKVIRGSLRDAAYYFGFIENNQVADLQSPRVYSFEVKKTM